jgi:hypothetical protein
MAEGDDPRDPTTASGMPQPWPVVDKHSTYEHEPTYQAPQAPSYGPPASYRPPQGPPRRSRWLVVALVVIVLVALLLWLFLR